jgi:hypothetical protein
MAGSFGSVDAAMLPQLGHSIQFGFIDHRFNLDMLCA